MSRLISTVSHLVLGVSLVLTGSGCSCGTGGPVGADVGSTPSSARASTGASEGCCDCASEEHDDSQGDCCDGGDCRPSARQGQVAPVAHLGAPEPTADLSAVPSPGPSTGVAGHLELRPWSDPDLRSRRGSDPPDARSTDLPRYLALQVLRI